MSATAARPKGPLILAIGLGAVTSLGLVMYLQQLQRDRLSEELVPLVVAAHEIKAETKLTAGDLTVRQVPRRLFPTAGLRRPADALNRISRTDLFRDDPLLDAKLYPLDSDGGMTFTIPSGKRAVTVAVDEVTGVAGFIKPGHRVDVIGTRDERGGDSPAKAQVVVQNIPVLAVAQQREDDARGKAKLVSSVTLMATPHEAELITLASDQGKIRLVLRAAGDNAVIKTSGAGWREHAPRTAAVPAPVRTVTVAPAPARPAVAPQPATLPPQRQVRPSIEVIRGSQRDTVGG